MRKKKALLPLLLGWVVFLILCILFVVHVQRTQKELQEEQSKKSSTTTEEIADNTHEVDEAIDEAFLENPLVEVRGKEMKTLIEGVLNAIADGNEKALRKLDLYPSTYDDKVSLEQGAKYIESYTNIKGYAKKGLLPSTYLVFVEADAKVKDCKILAPGLFRFYIVKNAKGRFRINTMPNDNLEISIANYLSEIEQEEDVLILIDEVNQRFKEACKKDKKLEEFEEKINSL